MEVHTATERMLPSIPESLPGTEGGSVSIFRRVIEWHLKHPGHVPGRQCPEEGGGAVQMTSYGDLQPDLSRDDSRSIEISEHTLSTEIQDFTPNTEISDHALGNEHRDLTPNTETPESGPNAEVSVSEHALKNEEARNHAPNTEIPDLTPNTVITSLTPSNQGTGPDAIVGHALSLGDQHPWISKAPDHAETRDKLGLEPVASSETPDHIPTTTHSLTTTPNSRILDPPNVPRDTTTYGDIQYYRLPAASAPRATELELILGTAHADTRRLPIHDLGGRESEFKLDACGFQLVHHASSLQRSDFDSDAVIKSRYHPELDAIVRSLYPAAVEIIQLGCILRGSLPRTDFSGDADADPAWNKPDRTCAPATRAHVDFTGKGVRLVLEQLWEDEGLDETAAQDRAAEIVYSGRRFVALSLWRPLKRVRRDPLAFCDGRTVKREDEVRLERVYPDGRRGENVVIRAGEKGREHEWYWVSGQDVEEMVVLKLFDSEGGKGGVVGGTPHCSFQLEGSEAEEVRESVEGRVVVCF